MSKPTSLQIFMTDRSALLGQRIERVRISSLYSERNPSIYNLILKTRRETWQLNFLHYHMIVMH